MYQYVYENYVINTFICLRPKKKWPVFLLTLLYQICSAYRKVVIAILTSTVGFRILSCIT